MLKETKKIVWIGGLALLVLVIIAAFTFSPSSEKQDTPKVNIPIDKNSNIVTDGEYIFFNSPEGEVMVMHAFDTTAETWIDGEWKVLSVSEKNLILQKDDKSITVFNREEKGIEETYNVKTDTAYCTEGAVYYKDPKTDCIMQIDRETKEEVVFLNNPVNDFLVFGEKLIVAQGGKNKGLALFDYSTGEAKLYMPDQVIKTVTFSDNMIVYTDAKGNPRRLNLYNGNDTKIEDVKSEGLCFSKGIYFYIEKAKDGYKLGLNNRDEYR